MLAWNHYEVAFRAFLQEKRVPFLAIYEQQRCRFDDGEPNFLYRLRASFREGKPIIPELNNLIDAPPPPKIKLEFDPNELSD